MAARLVRRKAIHLAGRSRAHLFGRNGWPNGAANHLGGASVFAARVSIDLSAPMASELVAGQLLGSARRGQRLAPVWPLPGAKWARGEWAAPMARPVADHRRRPQLAGCVLVAVPRERRNCANERQPASDELSNMRAASLVRPSGGHVRKRPLPTATSLNSAGSLSHHQARQLVQLRRRLPGEGAPKGLGRQRRCHARVGALDGCARVHNNGPAASKKEAGGRQERSTPLAVVMPSFPPPSGISILSPSWWLLLCPSFTWQPQLCRCLRRHKARQNCTCRAVGRGPACCPWWARPTPSR